MEPERFYMCHCTELHKLALDTASKLKVPDYPVSVVLQAPKALNDKDKDSFPLFLPNLRHDRNYRNGLTVTSIYYTKSFFSSERDFATFCGLYAINPNLLPGLFEEKPGMLQDKLHELFSRKPFHEETLACRVNGLYLHAQNTNNKLSVTINSNEKPDYEKVFDQMHPDKNIELARIVPLTTVQNLALFWKAVFPAYSKSSGLL
ncbi:MAG: hypothetical protein V1837_01105 [Candidatus Woesearchaeota archaeon]